MKSNTPADDVIVGIDLGTTNSEVAAMTEGQVRVLGPHSRILPSVVGFTPQGELLVGEAARNQQLLYPERTISSVKRVMGTSDAVVAAGKRLSPPEVSAIILRELTGWAEHDLGRRPRRAVITVPAYFSDAQRAATREAGELAGLEVVRILNEPTAASLAYGYSAAGASTLLVYDLGGGTFDVSIVTVEDDVTEVLSSHGDTHLGGDDFDALLLGRLCRALREEHGVDLETGEHPAALARLRRAAEEAKKQLSFEPYVTVREEGLVTVAGKPLHLSLEVSREAYEEDIRPLLERSLDSVSRALSDAGKSAGDLTGVLLVGGATRTPLVSALLEEMLGTRPRQDLHPDLCVALGAGLLAERLRGGEVGRVLVDVSPYSFGPNHLEDRDGEPYPFAYRPVIHRNTPLPVTRTEVYYTAEPMQTRVDLEIFQGEDPDALKNIRVGQFTIDGLVPTPEPSEVLCRMSLDLDGILKVSAIEKRTGKSRSVTIENALARRTDEEIREARARLDELFGARGPSDQGESWEQAAPPEGGVIDMAPAAREGASGEARGAGIGGEQAGEQAGQQAGASADDDDDAVRERAKALMERARGLLGTMHEEDREEAIDFNARIAAALKDSDIDELMEASEGLAELLFFVEGK